MMNNFDFTGKKVLITGGSGGMGSALVDAFLSRGAHVVVTSRKPNTLEELSSGKNFDRSRLHVIEIDLLNEEEISALHDKIQLAVGDLDILILAQGIVEPTSALNLSLESWDRQMQLNVTATFRLAQIFAPEMIKAGYGKIITFASMLTFQGGLNASAYAASKGGVGQLTKALSNEWAPSGVNVNSIAPGYIKTTLNQHIWKDPERNKSILARLTSGRWGTPEDIVGPTLFLSSSESDYIHGVILPVDGGWLSR
jgi:2-deoxy-D-gluconate 3-dehydrogenase